MALTTQTNNKVGVFEDNHNHGENMEYNHQKSTVVFTSPL